MAPLFANFDQNFAPTLDLHGITMSSAISPRSATPAGNRPMSEEKSPGLYLYEPSPEAVLATLLPLCNQFVYQALEAKVFWVGRPEGCHEIRHR